jgi:hypothetical protein
MVAMFFILKVKFKINKKIILKVFSQGEKLVICIARFHCVKNIEG